VVHLSIESRVCSIYLYFMYIYCWMGTGLGRMWLVYTLVVLNIRKDNFMVFKIKLPAEFGQRTWYDGVTD